MAVGSEDAGQDLMALLDLQSQGEGVFTGPPMVSVPYRQQVFGGLLLAQSLAAASFTVPEDAECHSLHAYFVRPGIPARPIDYEVSAMRDGQSYMLRNVVAVQRDELVFQMNASFGRDHGGAEFQMAMPDVPPPESFPPEDERVAKMLESADSRLRAILTGPKGPIEAFQVDALNFDSRAKDASPLRGWVRVRKPLLNDPRLHRCALAFASDMGLLTPSVRAIGAMYGDPDLQIASLDHAMWFHRPVAWEDWLLFVAESCSVSGGRGLSRGAIFTRGGELVASMAQEGVMRRRDPLPDRA